MMTIGRTLAALAMLAAGTFGAAAQPPAKELFGSEAGPSANAPQSFGFYSKGCIAGAMAMPKDGPTWQVMKVSRNRAWGHPAMIAFLQNLSRVGAAEDNWRGLLLGDIAQPRGGPMTSGHASHQIGLDADIYLTEMPKRRLTDDERDNMDLPSVIDPRTLRVNERRWRPEMMKLIRSAAESPQVQRIFVHPGIKDKLCKTAGRDRAWLNKVRPMYGHDYHFHVRIFCQPGSPGCEKQESTGTGDGCDLDWWFKVALRPPPPGAKPGKPRPALMLAQLPRACSAVLNAPAADGTAPAYAATAAPAAAVASAAPVAAAAALVLPDPARVPVPRSRPLG